MLKKFKISANKTEVGNGMLIDNIWNHFKSLPDFLNLGLKNYSGSNFNWKAQAKNLDTFIKLWDTHKQRTTKAFCSIFIKLEGFA